MNILFVCTGNTCRSPMAEALLRDRYPQVEVKSAGVFAADGSSASQHAEKTLEEKGITLDHHSQRVTHELLKWSDLVLTMTMQHKQVLVMEYPDHQDKFFTLKEYTGASPIEEMKELQVQMEDKRRKFIAENSQLTNEELQQKLDELVAADQAKLNELEAQNHNLDISDPFGGDLNVYRSTRIELEKQIERLVQKMDRTEED